MIVKQGNWEWLGLWENSPEFHCHKSYQTQIRVTDKHCDKIVVRKQEFERQVRPSD